MTVIHGEDTITITFKEGSITLLKVDGEVEADTSWNSFADVSYPGGIYDGFEMFLVALYTAGAEFTEPEIHAAIRECLQGLRNLGYDFGVRT